MMEVKIREAYPIDAQATTSCVTAAFEVYIERIGKPPAPMLLDFEAEIEAKHVWLAEFEGELGGVLVQYETEEGFYIDTLAVQPCHQGVGIGRKMLRFAEQEAMRRGYDSIYLCTNAKMTENQILYPHLGYVEYERKHQAGYDRIFYWKRLTTNE
jgi:ribosomal protein S18 acetylase RimI-like enzyme